jgi:DNA-binding MarR family transcriptional regulator
MEVLFSPQSANTMQKVQVQAEIDIKSFLAQLGNSELEAFLREVSALLAQRKAKDKAALEAALLLRLNEECELPPAHWARFEVLSDKREAEALTPSEQDELLSLIKAEEQLRLRRIQVLGELAQLRGTSLPELAEALGLIRTGDEQ